MCTRATLHSMQEWLFIELICDMFKHFVHSATSNVAWDRYQLVTYKASEGVAVFYNKLLDAASQLIHRPSELELVRRWQEQLPEGMWGHLVMHNNVTVELSPLRKVLDYALRYECGKRELKVRSSTGSATSGKPKDSTATAKPVVHTTVSVSPTLPTAFRLVRRSPSRGRGRDSSRDRSGRFCSRSWDCNRADGAQARPQVRFTSPTAVVTASAGLSGSSASTQRPGTPPTERSKLCYRCGQAGHFAAAHDDPKSPLYMRAMNAGSSVVDDREEEKTDTEGAEAPAAEESGPDGSQYKSEDEYVLEEYEQFSSDDNDGPALRAMHTGDNSSFEELIEDPVSRSQRLQERVTL
jgi:hypothetical protein